MTVYWSVFYCAFNLTKNLIINITRENMLFLQPGQFLFTDSRIFQKSMLTSRFVEQLSI